MELPEPNEDLTGTVRLDIGRSILRLLSCSLCPRQIRPPIYYCFGTKDAGHLACPACFEKLSGGKCLVCENGGPCSACSGKLPGAKCPLCDQGGVFKHCPAIENLLTASVVECKNKGCASWISLFDFEAHERECPFQPVSQV